MGLSCGNPTATASLRPGEVVLDLGCGGGLDVFLSAQRVGPTGKAIGIDMTPEMVALSRKNAAKSGITNIEFHQATIDAMRHLGMRRIAIASRWSDELNRKLIAYLTSADFEVLTVTTADDATTGAFRSS